MAAVAADMHGHVFNNAEDGHAHLLKHLQALLGIDQGDVLRGGHDDGAGDGHALRQGQLDIASARRHVHHQIVQILPARLAQELLKRLGGHGAAPDHGLVLLDEEADGHHLQAMRHQRLHGLAILALWLTVNTQHQRQAGAVNVGIQNADARAFGGQRQRQIGRRGALAHAALARGHGDDVFHTGQQLHAALHRMRGDLAVQVHADIGHAFDLAGSGHQLAAQLGNLARRRITQLDFERHITISDAQVLELLGADKVLRGIGVDNGLQGLQQGGFLNGRHGRARKDFVDDPSRALAPQSGEWREV